MACIHNQVGLRNGKEGHTNYVEKVNNVHSVAGLGRLSAGAKMAMKPFVKRVFTIFATNASFLRVISNFRI